MTINILPNNLACRRMQYDTSNFSFEVKYRKGVLYCEKVSYLYIFFNLKKHLKENHKICIEERY